jgi:alpha-beta hydrolase superfamily lysophospholipase
VNKPKEYGGIFMNQESFTFTGINGQKIFVRSWSGNNGPRCVLLIIHGMAEYGGRYSDFAGFLNKRGITVYAADMRGHGETGERNGNLCDLDNDGFNGIVEDHTKLAGLLHEKHAGIPLFILGHSFGSFIAQEFIKRHGKEIDGEIGRAHV